MTGFNLSWSYLRESKTKTFGIESFDLRSLNIRNMSGHTVFNNYSWMRGEYLHMHVVLINIAPQSMFTKKVAAAHH